MTLTISEIREVLDTRQVPYQDPEGDESQLILRGTADIIESSYGLGYWEFYFRCTKTKPTRTYRFRDVAELLALLDSDYVQQPYDALSYQPIPA